MAAKQKTRHSSFQQPTLAVGAPRRMCANSTPTPFFTSCLSIHPSTCLLHCMQRRRQTDRPTHHTMIINVDASPFSSGTLLSFNYLLIIAPSTKERILQRGIHCTFPSYLSLLLALCMEVQLKIYSEDCFL